MLCQPAGNPLLSAVVPQQDETPFEPPAHYILKRLANQVLVLEMQQLSVFAVAKHQPILGVVEAEFFRDAFHCVHHVVSAGANRMRRGFQPRVDHNDEDGEGHDHGGRQTDQNSQHSGIETTVGKALPAGWEEIGGRHRRVVHAGDRGSHRKGRGKP